MKKYESILKDKIIKSGIKHPKKHGDWYSLRIYDDNYLVFDTWNGQIYHYPNGATPSDTDNMYRCVYVFYDDDGKVDNYSTVKLNMFGFWCGHII